MLLLFEKHTLTSIEQTKTKPQETLELVMHEQIETISFSPALNLLEEGKWLLVVTFSEATNSVFDLTDENNSFSFTIAGQWDSNSAEKTLDELKIY